MDWPKVSVLVITYDRPEEIRLTIAALSRDIMYTGPIEWVVADDGSPPGYLSSLLADFLELKIVPSVTNRGGWGRNVNNAIALCQGDYIFFCEDDYVSRRPIDLYRGVALMLANPKVGLIRYDGLEGHRLNLELREQQTQMGAVSYCSIMGHSPHLNIYSNRPHLKSKKCLEYYGKYPEGKKLGVTEEEYAHRIKDKLQTDPNAIEVAILSSGLPQAFDHIGKSRQGSKEDV